MYKCSACANHQSPACIGCYSINDGKPTQYVALSHINTASSIEDAILNCIKNNVPIPYKLHYLYNKQRSE